MYYIATDTDNNLVKIGESSNPLSRLKELRHKYRINLRLDKRIPIWDKVFMKRDKRVYTMSEITQLLSPYSVKITSKEYGSISKEIYDSRYLVIQHVLYMCSVFIPHPINYLDDDIIECFNCGEVFDLKCTHNLQDLFNCINRLYCSAQCQLDYKYKAFTKANKFVSARSECIVCNLTIPIALRGKQSTCSGNCELIHRRRIKWESGKDTIQPREKRSWEI